MMIEKYIYIYKINLKNYIATSSQRAKVPAAEVEPAQHVSLGCH